MCNVLLLWHVKWARIAIYVRSAPPPTQYYKAQKLSFCLQQKYKYITILSIYQIWNITPPPPPGGSLEQLSLFQLWTYLFQPPTYYRRPKRSRWGPSLKGQCPPSSLSSKLHEGCWIWDKCALCSLHFIFLAFVGQPIKYSTNKRLSQNENFHNLEIKNQKF